MEKESVEIGKFAFVLRLFRHPDGRTEYVLETANKGVDHEMIIMKLRAVLSSLEKDYFDNFEKSTLKMQK